MQPILMMPIDGILLERVKEVVVVNVKIAKTR